MKSAAACVLFSLLAGPAALPSAPFTPDERATWDDAVRYYDRELASKDLLVGEGMASIKDALVRARLETLYATTRFTAPARGSMDDAIARTVAAVTAVP